MDLLDLKNRTVVSMGCKREIATVGWILAKGKSETEAGGNGWLGGVFDGIGEAR
jgi:hypothetical protein